MNKTSKRRNNKRDNRIVLVFGTERSFHGGFIGSLPIRGSGITDGPATTFFPNPLGKVASSHYKKGDPTRPWSTNATQ
jgi:hypothetical protein